MPSISVQMVVGERTVYGAQLLRTALECMLTTSTVGYAKEFVIVDNDMGYDARRVVDDTLGDFPHTVVSMPGEQPFAALRNAAFAATGEGITTVHWYDSDEAYRPETLKAVYEAVEEHPEAAVRVQFYHFLPDPKHYQFIEPRVAIFPFHKGLHWEGSVHEHLVGLPDTDVDLTRFPELSYFHFGYTKQQVLLTIRWVHYAVLEEGNANRYVESEEMDHVVRPYFREDRMPDQVIDDRVRIAKPFDLKRQGPYPEPVWRNLLLPWDMSGLPWPAYVASLDPGYAASLTWWKRQVAGGRATWRDWIDTLVHETWWRNC